VSVTGRRKVRAKLCGCSMRIVASAASRCFLPSSQVTEQDPDQAPPRAEADAVKSPGIQSGSFLARKCMRAATALGFASVGHFGWVTTTQINP
jgi:hypothetical protein